MKFMIERKKRAQAVGFASVTHTHSGSRRRHCRAAAACGGDVADAAVAVATVVGADLLFAICRRGSRDSSPSSPAHWAQCSFITHTHTHSLTRTPQASERNR